MHQVRFIEADCRHCRRSFPIPLLSDFSYGLFVLYGERGGVFGYLSAFDCPSFEDISSRLLAVIGHQKFTKVEIPRFQRVLASCADKIGGQPLGLEPVCPFCRSRSVRYDESKLLDADEIPGVTFTEFQSLSDTVKMKRLAELWNRD